MKIALSLVALVLSVLATFILIETSPEKLSTNGGMTIAWICTMCYFISFGITVTLIKERN